MLYLACALAALALTALAVAIWSLSWPRVKGTIHVSIFDVEKLASSDGGTSTEKQGRFYLAYSYEVGGIQFQGGRVTPLGHVDWQITGHPTLSGARGLAHWYREGASVDVYYCPLRPQWACLEPGGFGTAVLLGVIAVVWFWLA